MVDSIVWIHRELDELDSLDRAKIGIDYFVRNIKARNNFTNEELDELNSYFSREIKGMHHDIQG